MAVSVSFNYVLIEKWLRADKHSSNRRPGGGGVLQFQVASNLQSTEKKEKVPHLVAGIQGPS